MRTERKSQDGVLGGESPRSFRRRFDSVADGVPEAAKAALDKQEAVLNQKCVTMLSGSAMKKQEEDDERRDWIIANGEQHRKRQTLSQRVFINKIFRVRIDDVKKRHDGREHPDAEVYSTVKEIIARLWP